MKEIEIYKAQKIGKDFSESVRIIINEEIPEIKLKKYNNESLKQLYKIANKKYKEQAKKLGNVLISSLPGGTIDNLLIFLLEHKKSILKVKY